MQKRAVCPLCAGAGINQYYEDKQRVYLQCSRCELVHVPAEHWLDAAAERAEYDLHQNSGADPGYRRFLSRLSEPMLERLQPGMAGLDFGCGPGPVLAQMLREQGLQVDLFDPFYFDDPALLRKQYDFITASEVVEHLQRPAEEFERLFCMLRPGGVLGIMTKLVRSPEAFSGWHYIRDLTHIAFYSRRTFEYIAARFGADLSFSGQDVILLEMKD